MVRRCLSPIDINVNDEFFVGTSFLFLVLWLDVHSFKHLRNFIVDAFSEVTE